MSEVAENHSAEAGALGFYYQSLYALFALLQSEHDDAAVSIEHLEDVELIANGQPLLSQLKHTMSAAPSAITISSRNLWRTLKVWIDVLDKVVLHQTTFQLVTVAPIRDTSSLAVLTDLKKDRTALHEELIDEARRVTTEYERAKQQRETPLPHSDRVRSCQAFLDLQEGRRRALLDRVLVRSGMANIAGMPDLVAQRLRNFPASQRKQLAQRLIEWWDLQIIFTLCGKRERFIGLIEVQQKTSELAGELERDELTADFFIATQPKEHAPDSVLVRQIELVNGTESDLSIATREEWRARSQRHKWTTDRLDMGPRILEYDKVLVEAWSDRHERLKEDCKPLRDQDKCARGHQLLRWCLESSHKEVPEFAPKLAASYYVRGTYQILAIDLDVGWHPEFREKLGSDK